MPTIKGFTTKKDIAKQLKNSGVTVTMPFQTVGDFNVEKDDGIKMKGYDGKKLKKVKKAKTYFVDLHTKHKTVLKAVPIITKLCPQT